jgi:hypothetical protein
LALVIALPFEFWRGFEASYVEVFTRFSLWLASFFDVTAFEMGEFVGRASICLLILSIIIGVLLYSAFKWPFV